MNASAFARMLGVVCACTAACTAAPLIAAEANFPTRPIRLIVAFAPGGSLDRAVRVIAPRLGEALGEQVVIDNRPGAGGNLSAEITARATPDGYTLYVTSGALVVNVSLYRKLNYDPLRDLAPVTLLGANYNVLVAHPTLGVKSVSDLIELAKASPGKINYVSSGNGTSGHLAMALFTSMTGIQMVHIPYKSIAQAQADLVAGQVPLFFPTIPGALPFIQAGRVIPLGVSGPKRSAALPGVPTVAEAGVKDFEASAWYPVMVPAGTPRSIIERLQTQIAATLKTPEVNKSLTADGVETIGSTPEYLSAYMRSEMAKWAKVVKAAGIAAQ